MDVEHNNIENLFNKAVQHITNNNDKASTINDEIKINLYKYYKQATIGDCNLAQPSIFDFKNKIKWEAWNSIKGLSKNKAQCLYIKLVESIDPSFNNAN